MLDKKELEFAFQAQARGGRCSYNDQVGMLFKIDMQRTLILVDKLSLMVSLFARSLFYHSVLCQYYQLGIFKQSKKIYMTSFLAWSLWELAFVWNNG